VDDSAAAAKPEASAQANTVITIFRIIKLLVNRHSGESRNPFASGRKEQDQDGFRLSPE
jgi:hypothetical protein